MTYSTYEIALDRELAKRSLKEFIKMAWHVVEPGRDFVDNWHIDAICERLEGILEGKYNPKLVINVPPGHMKTHIMATFFPAWVWTMYPDKDFIFASAVQRTASKMLANTLSLVESDWYQDRWGEVWRPSKWDWGKTTAGNDKMGSIKTFAIASRIIGHHADFFIVDDPIDADGTRSKAELEKSTQFFKEYVSTRLHDLTKSSRIIIMQRLHETDMAGIALETGTYDHICFPAEFDSSWDSPGYLREYDKRSQDNEILWADRFPKEVLDEKRSDSQLYASQYQQRPTPSEGGIFKVDWFTNYWKAFPERAQFLQSWDMAFKGTDTSDYVVCQIWGWVGSRFYLIDQLRERLDFPQTREAMKMMSRKWPRATLKLVEAKANGQAIIDDLKRELTKIISINPRGSKQARASSIAPLWEAGNIYIPDPDTTPWVNDFIHECTVFDKGKHDDQVDAMTQALDRLQNEVRDLTNYRRNSMLFRF